MGSKMGVTINAHSELIETKLNVIAYYNKK